MKIVYKTLHGSHAYGLNGPKSDIDIRGVFLSDPIQILGLNAGKQTVKGEGEDEVYWELKHFVGMCLQGNPNALEILFTKPSQHEINMLGPIYQFRNLLLTKNCKNTFGGYAVQNLRKLKQLMDTYDRNEAIRKDSMHLVRLLLFSKQILGEGHLNVFFEKTDPDKNMLISIRAGIIPATSVVEYAEKAILEINELANSCPEQTEDVHDFFNKAVANIYWNHLKASPL